MSDEKSPHGASIELKQRAYILTEAEEASPKAGLWRTLRSIVSKLPALKVDPKPQERPKLGGLRLTLLGLGLLLVIASERSVPIIIVGFSIMGSAGVLPLSRARQQAWLRALRERERVKITRKTLATLIHDGRRLELWIEDKKQRRVLTDRAFNVDIYRAGSRRWISVRPPKGPKRETIWFSDAPPQAQLEGLKELDPTSVGEQLWLEDDAQELLRRLEILQASPRDLTKL